MIKSAVLTRLTKGDTWGYDKDSITETWASRLYKHTVSVPFKEHAVTRNRLILARSLGYSIDDLELDYGIENNDCFNQALAALSQEITIPEKFIMALHGTSRVNKEWPVEHWDSLIKEMEKAAYSILLP